MEKIYLKQTFDILPHEHIEAKVNEYALFMKEYNISNKYRLIFSFNPICSNVLFNTITEITKDEGSDNCVCYNYISRSASIGIDRSGDLYEYLKYTKRIDEHDETKFLNKDDLIMDTAYSHPNVGNFNYHCGYDIFDNHILRSKDFVVVNKINDNINEVSERQCFNTLSDYLRDSDGVLKFDRNLKNKTDEPVELMGVTLMTDEVKKHLYTSDSVMSFHISISDNLTEKDGWMGFVNKGNLQIANYKDYVINKVINNEDIGTFVDMYPDRSLYSPLPKFNKFRKRYEDNWKFCITYPYEVTYDNSLVKFNGYNGIECILKLDGTLQIGTAPSTSIITLRTFVEHGLSAGDKIKLAYFWHNENGILNSGETVNTCTVINVSGNAYEKKQYFKIRVDDIRNLITNIYTKVSGEDENGIFAVGRDYFENNNIKFRFCRVVSDSKCEYYIRKFKRLTKSDGSDYSYTLNKLAFSKNIYNDRICEVIFDDTIDVSDVKDNLGFPLHEIFISVFKTNHGYKEWYGTKENNYTFSGYDETVEFSHCFGEVTSGFDMPSDKDCIDYNVHRLHNISVNNAEVFGIPLSGAPLESNICLSIQNDIFYGDLVEFNEKTLEERTLEDVYYRFNTAQRETLNESFSGLTYHEIHYDDYDVNNTNNKSFLEENSLNATVSGWLGDLFSKTPVNLNPEGYFYKAHYRIPLKEYNSRVYWGKDTLVNIVSSIYKGSGRTYAHTTYDELMYEYQIVCDKIYYMAIYDKIYLINKTDNNDIVYGEVIEFNDNIYNIIINKRINIIDYKFFKVNPSKPEYAHTLKDGSGEYNWRLFKEFDEINSDSELYNRPFTNNTHYLHENINLYLKRQDPNGIYGLSFNQDTPFFKTNLVISGNEKEINNKEYIENIEQGQC